MKVAEVGALLREALAGGPEGWAAAKKLGQAQNGQWEPATARALQAAWDRLQKTSPAVARDAGRITEGEAPGHDPRTILTDYRRWLTTVGYGEWLAENDGFDGELPEAECRQLYADRIKNYEARVARR